ncbi:Bbp19 family protein [Azospirillum sp. ST 5-10]|uniref:Bbp19 family protein n=1 Tax=unclassified Azospirillum TaxID=2630922 RepID=UPI003F4A5EE7
MADPFHGADGWPWPAAPVPPPADDPAPCFARCFAGADGARALAVLRAMTLERALGPDVPDAALRHLEGQRQLVATILALVARGGGPRFPR